MIAPARPLKSPAIGTRPLFPLPERPLAAQRAGLRSALAVWEETHDLAALELAVRIQRNMEATAPAGEPVAELILKACAWCPADKTAPLRAFAARHAIRISDGICPACRDQMRAEIARGPTAPQTA